MSLKELVPILEDRLTVILAGNPFEVSLPYSPPPGITDGFPIGVITHRAATDHLAPLTRLFKFDFARDPETNLVPFDLTDIMPYLPGLEPAFPDPSQVVIFPWDIIREINVALEIEFDVDREDNLPLSSEKFAVIGAGTAGRLAFLYGQEYLRTGLAETLQFLTHQPEEKPILFDQPDFVYYLHNLAKEESLYLKVVYEDLQGTWQAWEPEASQFSAKTYGVYCIPCGPSQLRLPESARRYEVAIVNAQNQRLSHVRTYHIDYTPYENAMVLFFQNSFGVFDSIALTGESITKGTYESKVSPLLKAGFNEPQSRTTYRKEKVEMTYQTGQYPPGWKVYFSELLRSKRVALYQDGIFQYVNVSNADAELSNTHEPSYSLEITLSSEDASSFNAL